METVDTIEALETKYQQLCDALNSFDNRLKRYSQELKRLDLSILQDHELADMLRDSIIQRFEYSFELMWKYLSLYLSVKEAIIPDVIASRSVFRAACKAHILSGAETALALEMVESRNKTSHMYKEEIADYLAALSRSYCDLMLEFKLRLQPVK